MALDYGIPGTASFRRELYERALREEMRRPDGLFEVRTAPGESVKDAMARMTRDINALRAPNSRPVIDLIEVNGAWMTPEDAKCSS